MTEEVTQHALLKEWMIGKQLKTEFTGELLLEYMEYRNLDKQTTSLSKKVCKLVLFDNEDLEEPFESYLDEKLLLKWHNMTKNILVRGDDTTNEDILFAKSAKTIHKVAKCVHEQMFVENNGKIIRSYLNDQRLLTIISNKSAKIFEMFMDVLDERDALLSFQCIVPFLERGLQDVLYNYWLYAQQEDKNSVTATVDEKTMASIRQRVPTKLNELFLLPELKLVLGEDIVFLLRAFIGPLNGLNLRNVTIHGFITPEEFHPSYATFLFVLIASLGDLVSTYFQGREYYYREWFDFNIDIGPTIVDHTSLAQDATYIQEHLFQTSLFILPQWLSCWKKSLDLYMKQRYFHFLVSIFPLMEHSIRRIYVCSNEVEDRLITAEKDALYTTLDILLETRQGDQNKIFNELGPVVSNFLFDIFIWTDSGIRIRDHVSHGNVNPFAIPHNVADRVLVIALALCNKYAIGDQEFTNTIASVEQFMNSQYEPLYHPKSVLARKIERVQEITTKFDQFLQSHNITLDGTDELSKRLIERIQLCTMIIQNKYEKLSDFSSIFIVHESEKEMRKCIILGKIMLHVQEMAEKLETSITELDIKVKERTAWKRDRKALEVLRSHVCTYQYLFQFLLISARYELHVGKSEESDVMFVLSLWNVSGSVTSHIDDGKWLRAYESLLGLFISPTEFGDTLPYKTINARQVKQLFVDISGYYNGKINEPSLDGA
jgi:hypothetical protein